VCAPAGEPCGREAGRRQHPTRAGHLLRVICPSYPEGMGMQTHRVRSPGAGLGVTDRAILARLRSGSFDGPFSEFVALMGHPATRTLMSAIKLSERGLIEFSGEVAGDVHARLVRQQTRQRRSA
jgi:hypothetical protein